MYSFWRSAGIAACIAAAVQCFFVGVLADRLPREVCRPGVHVERSLSLPAVKTLHISNTDGAIHVNTHRAEEIKLTADIRAYTTASEAIPAAEEYVNSLLNTEILPECVVLKTEVTDRPEGIDLQVDYSLFVPEGTVLVLTGENGNIFVQGAVGALSIEGNATDIEVTGTTGPVRARSNIGRIRVDGMQSTTDLQTVNGNIHATLAGGKLKAESTNGSIYATLASPDIAGCDLNSMNGGVTLVVSDGCSADVHARSERGRVQADLTTGLVAEVQKQHELRGRIGEGSIQLSLQSLNGNIWLTRSGA